MIATELIFWVSALWVILLVISGILAAVALRGLDPYGIQYGLLALASSGPFFIMFAVGLVIVTIGLLRKVLTN